MADKAEKYCWFMTPYLIITDEMADIGINQIAIYSYDDTNSYDITQEDIDALYDGVKGIRAISAGYGAEGSVMTQKGEFKANINGRTGCHIIWKRNRTDDHWCGKGFRGLYVFLYL